MLRRGAGAAILAGTALLAATTSFAGPAEARPPVEGKISKSDRPAEVPDDATLEAAGAVVGEIVFRAQDIFDLTKPSENNPLFRAANALHPRTKVSVIRRLLLFHTGERYEGRLLRESERILRSQRYFYTADVRPIRYHDGRVDVEVVTRDVWTLNFGLGFGRSGGTNTSRIGLEDANFLGYGKDVTLRRSKSVDRTEMLYRYRDPALGGTRWAMTAAYSDNSDGWSKEFSVQRPFYALDTRWSVFAGGTDYSQVTSLYDRGLIIAQFRDDSKRVDLSYGTSAGLHDGRALRWIFGATFDEHRFEPLTPAAPPGGWPEDRTLVYPWAGIEVVRDGFIEARDVDQIVKTEDLNLGAGFSIRTGLSEPAWGGDRPRAIFQSGGSAGFRPDPEQLLFLDGHAVGRVEPDGFRNVLVGGGARWYYRDFREHLLTWALGVDAAHRLDADDQLLLGGDNGLRGYPLRYAWGDRRVLFSAEQRFYTQQEILHLVRLGAAVFVDTGRCWFAGEGPPDPGWLSDVGVGLRLALSRSARGAMLHVDLAYALNPAPGVKRVQLLFVARNSF